MMELQSERLFKVTRTPTTAATTITRGPEPGSTRVAQPCQRKRAARTQTAKHDTPATGFVRHPEFGVAMVTLGLTC